MRVFIFLLFVMLGLVSCQSATEESSGFGEAFHYNHPGYPYEPIDNNVNNKYGQDFNDNYSPNTYWYSPTQQQVKLTGMGGSSPQGNWFLHNMDTYYSDVEHLQIQLLENTAEFTYEAEFGYNTKYNNDTNHIIQDDTNLITITGIKNVPRGGLVGMIKYVIIEHSTGIVYERYYDIYAGDWEDL